MKLGIVVVYLVADEDEKLLDLHLQQIQKHTTAPYVIYAGVNRLSEKFRVRLRQLPELRICTLAPTDTQGDPEHAFYLDQLVQIAIDDGSTHVVTMHTDSFPIRSGWAEDLDARLGAAAFSTVWYGPYTGCLFFRREFYVNNHPRFLLSEEERQSGTFQQFARRHEHIRHAGIGYLFRAYERGLEWRILPESNPGDAFGVIYDEMIFHLQGNARLQPPSPSARGRRHKPVTVQLVRHAHRLIRNLVPKSVRLLLWMRFESFFARIDRVESGYKKQELLNDPDALFDRIANKKRARGAASKESP